MSGLSAVARPFRRGIKSVWLWLRRDQATNHNSELLVSIGCRSKVGLVVKVSWAMYNQKLYKPLLNPHNDRESERDKREREGKTDRETDRINTDQLTPLSTLIVGKEAEAFVAVTFQQHHTCRRTPVPLKTEREIK